MSIVTKKGDDGSTGLMYHRRVPKSHPRVEAYGSADELNAALGVARALLGWPRVAEQVLSVQKDLVALMGELATVPEDRARYQADGYPSLGREATARLEEWIREVESQSVSFQGWATPGATAESAALEVARTVCRRAERRVWALDEVNPLNNREIPVYLNRLGDWLWLLARWAEGQASDRPA